MKIRNEVLLAIGYAVLILIIIFQNKPKPPDISNEYRERIERLQWQYDSLLIIERRLEDNYEVLDNKLKENEQRTEKLQKRYDKLKNRKPVDFTDHQIDSILTARYGRPLSPGQPD
jgi:adenylate kinase family enzyme